MHRRQFLCGASAVAVVLPLARSPSESVIVLKAQQPGVSTAYGEFARKVMQQVAVANDLAVDRIVIDLVSADQSASRIRAISAFKDHR